MSALKREISMTEETRIALLEQAFLHLNKSIEEFKQEFDKIQGQLYLFKGEMNSQFRWTMGVMISLFSGLYATFIGGILAKMFGLI